MRTTGVVKSVAHAQQGWERVIVLISLGARAGFLAFSQSPYAAYVSYDNFDIYNNSPQNNAASVL